VVVLWFLMMLEAPPKLKQGCRSETQRKWLRRGRGWGPPGRCECLRLGCLWLGRQPSHPRGPRTGGLVGRCCFSPAPPRAAGNISDTFRLTISFFTNLRPQVSHANPIRCYKYLAFRDPLPSFVCMVLCTRRFPRTLCERNIVLFLCWSPSSCLTSSSRCRSRSFKFRVTTLVFDSMWSDTRLSDFSL